jgi:transcriptional regulator with XRE-family HTH domain
MADVLPKKTKKMLLFVSPGNSIWTKFPEKQPIGQNTIASRLGVSHGTIPNWKNGSPIFPDTAEHIFKTFSNYIDKAELSDEARREIIDTFNKFRENYKSEETTVYNTGDDLGMEMEDCQKIIDHVIYARSPRPHYGTAAIAQEYFERY